MKPLQKWRSDIEEECWDKLKKLPTKKEKKEICEWDGWHPIIKAQLEMFFDLKKKHIINN